ncbi:roquin-1 [Biomphalaria glabrata]|nr:roquin-1-like [Biomphalaria glabrata]
MPFQGLPWTEFISCPVCCKVFNECQQRPISLGCGHTVCKSCIRSKLNDNRCPFDQIVLPSDVDKLPANFALMHLVGAAVPEQEKEAVKTVSDNPKSYEQARKCIEEMAVHLKPLAENASDDDSSICSETDQQKTSQSPSGMNGNNLLNNNTKCVLSRPMQRKLISLIHCQLLEEEGRSRAARIARSLGERIVSELLVLHQYPHQLSANLWAAVRTRGCQFLGPAMQEEVLKLILLALEDGSFLSRKVLVLFVVQRLESRYPQASKTAIGHVVQLLYRASCFKVLKREEESSLMQLKEEFRQYESLRREHDSQIVQIAIEAGLRISPEHWSSLLYGDTAHKSHMQSIIDKHQSPQSFAQSITELMSTLQRSSDHSGLLKLQPQLEFLSNIDPGADCPAPSWENLEAIMRSLNTVMTSYVEFLSNPDHRSRLEAAPIQNTRYKTSMCRDFFSARGTCPRGNTCTFAHSQEELERYRSRSRRNGSRGPACTTDKTSSFLTPSESDQLRQVQLMSKLKMEANSPGIKSLSLLGKSHSVASLLDGKVASVCLHESLPLINKLAAEKCTLMPHQKMSLQTNGVLGHGDGRLISKPLDPEKPPFIPPGLTTPQRMYGPPTMDSLSDCNGIPPLIPQTCYPSAHINGAYPHSPQLHSSLPPTPFPGSHVMPPPFPLPPMSVSSSVRHMHPHVSPPMAKGSVPLSSAPIPLNTRSSFGQPQSDCCQVSPPDLTRGSAEAAYCTGSVALESCDSLLQNLPPHQLGRYNSQGGSLEHLNLRKQEILSYLQDSTFTDASSTAYGSVNTVGVSAFSDLKNVLGGTIKKRETMPTHVSDMYVATRTTRSLEDLMNDDMNSYPMRWSNGDDNFTVPISGIASEMPYDSLARGPPLDSSTTNSISFTMAAVSNIESLFETAGTSKLYSPEDQDVPSTGGGDAEFSSFPRDDGDENFIPFEHTSVSKFGPISRLNRMKMVNSAPVQVTADSYKQVNPVLMTNPMDRPLATTMTVPSRFPTPTIKEGLDLSMRPASSYCNKSQLLTNYNNVVKSGGQSSLTETERLAFELQAIEFEISKKTGREPETVGKIIQNAVGLDGNRGSNHNAVIEQEKIKKANDQKAVQQMVDNFSRSWPGLKKEVSREK